MNMNPLYDYEPFQLTLANPNPSSSKTKEGPVYRVSFELTRDEWDWFMEAETKGMVLECEVTVSHRNEPAAPGEVIPVADRHTKHIKGGPLSQRSDALARDPEFQAWLRAAYPGFMSPDEPSVEAARRFIRARCGVETRAELDHNMDAAKRFQDTVLSPFLRSVAA